jgi:hypothetical protein
MIRSHSTWFPSPGGTFAAPASESTHRRREMKNRDRIEWVNRNGPLE